MAKVFIANEPDKSKVPEGRTCYDVSPASVFGELIFVFGVNSLPPVRNREKAVERAHQVLCQATPGDFLVWAGGDPLGMVITAAIMADYTNGKFNYLLWDWSIHAYAPVPVALFGDNSNES